MVEYSSAVQGAANVQSYGIHGDHTSICRFENEESPGYDVLVRALIDWREAAPDAVGLKWAQYRAQVMLSNMHNNMSPTGFHIGTRKCMHMVHLLRCSSTQVRCLARNTRGPRLPLYLSK